MIRRQDTWFSHAITCTFKCSTCFDGIHRLAYLENVIYDAPITWWSSLHLLNWLHSFLLFCVTNFYDLRYFMRLSLGYRNFACNQKCQSMKCTKKKNNNNKLAMQFEIWCNWLANTTTFLARATHRQICRPLFTNEMHHMLFEPTYEWYFVYLCSILVLECEWPWPSVIYSLLHCTQCITYVMLRTKCFVHFKA